MSEYDTDFYGWTSHQAALLRAGRLAEVDAAHIADEIESMGRSEKRELVNRLAVLLQHLLKWQAQPGRRGTSRRLTIEEQRDRVRVVLDENPSLRSKLPEALNQAWRSALRGARMETELDDTAFPASNPWPYETLIDDSFYPE